MANRTTWEIRAEAAQEETVYGFWNERLRIMNQAHPCDDACNEHFVYWWHAHVVDALMDGFERTRNSRYLARIERIVEGVRGLNGDTLLHNYYDDMEWMALALLRVYDATRSTVYKEHALTLWESIKTAWNEHGGGGLAWKKDQLDYKNTPANAPACILAARLYQRFGDPEDFLWAKRIYDWMKANLVDPHSGYVWDGWNRQGDGKIDYDWCYTYCQGVWIGAGIELYSITGDAAFLSDAVKTAEWAIERFAPGPDGVIGDEGPDDCGLFKGIFVRYLRELLRIKPELRFIKRMLIRNAESLWSRSRNERGLIGRSWQGPVEPEVQLSAQLSGLMLLEAAASLPNTAT